MTAPDGDESSSIEFPPAIRHALQPGRREPGTLAFPMPSRDAIRGALISAGIALAVEGLRAVAGSRRRRVQHPIRPGTRVTIHYETAWIVYESDELA